MERPRRPNAGSRMNKLIEEAQDDEEESEDAEFYKNTYGGFNEEGEDNDYQSEDEQEDIVDSDFSLSEREDEVENNDEDDTKRRRKKYKIKTFKNKSSDSTVPKVKKPYVKKVVEAVPLDKQARMRSTTLLKGAEVTARRLHVQDAGIKRHPRMPQMRRLTQEELVAEAKITEAKNTASLAHFLKLEEEKKKVKVTKTKYQGPTIRFQSVRMPEFVDVITTSTADDGNTGAERSDAEQFVCRNFLEFSDTMNFPKRYFPYPSKVRYPGKAVCVVTGQLAKYKDPVTGLPYATIEAFKYIRQHQQKLQEKMNKVRTEGATRKRKKVSLY